MVTNIQIRSVDDALAAATKAEAARRRLSVSDYLKLLIREDLHASSAAREREIVYRRIVESPLRGRVDADTVASALAEVREEMGTE